MPNLVDPKCSDPKCAKELTEEDLEQISGGAGGDGTPTTTHDLVPGTYTVKCPFCDSVTGRSVSRTFGSGKYLSEVNPFGTLSCCQATVRLESASVAMCTKGLITTQQSVNYSKC